MRKWLSPLDAVTGLLLAVPLVLRAVEPDGAFTASSGAAIPFQVIESKTVAAGSRFITYNRVVPPVAPATTAAPVTQAPESVPSDAAIESAEPPQKQETLFVCATVYDTGISEFTWNWQGREIRAFSNIDFNQFGAVTEFETSDTGYSLLVMSSGAGAPNPGGTVPARTEFSATRSEFMIDSLDASLSNEAFATIEALHCYYDANRAQIISDATARQIASSGPRQEPPPPPTTTVINYWPVKSRAYLGSEGAEVQP